MLSRGAAGETIRRMEDSSKSDALAVAAGATLGLGLVAAAAYALRGRGTVFTIVMENHSASQVIGPDAMPYLNSLAAGYGHATDYRSRLRPSLPNYLVMTSGRDWGVRDDAYHLIDGDENVFAQMDRAGVPWRAYAESMGAPCRTSSSGLYASRHNPAVYYRSVVGDRASCSSRVLDLSAMWSEVGSGSPPRYVWITPNLVSDAHDGTLAQGDAWLASVVPWIMGTRAYRSGGVIFILFDEGGGGADPTRLPAVVVSERLRSRPLADPTPYGHASYLAAVQDFLGLPRLPGTAGVASMAAMLR